MLEALRLHEPAKRSMTPDQVAVTCLLDRMQRDADLRWVMLHTDAFQKLCEAEAARTGETPKMVAARRSIDLRPKYRRQPAKLPRALKHLEWITHAGHRVIQHFGPVELTGGEGLQELFDALAAVEQEGGLL